MDRLSLARDDIEIWPRRLLHVPSMTSLEQQPGNIYGGVKEPPYNILSYTWGRWAIPSGQALPVQNVSWKIPAVDPARFTVAAFQHVIHQVADGVSHVWVDVACIDQVNEAVKDDQIGKQAGIFNNAEKAYVWLHGTSTIQLQGFVNAILDLAERLNGDQLYEVNFTDDTEGGFLNRYGANFHQPTCVDEPSWSATVASVVQELLRDPWFSSLWTLQESFLRPDARLLSREGEQPIRRGYVSCRLANLIIALNHIQSAIGARLFQLRHQASPNSNGCSTTSATLQASLRVVLDVLSPLALGAWDSAPLLYHAAARRTTSDPADRVYSIMQVFGFCLGRAAESHRRFTLAELEDQLGLALCNASPVLGQYFVHDEEPEKGKAWRVARSVRLPEVLRLVAVAPESRCEIRPDDPGGRPVFRGVACRMEEMMACWKQMKTWVDDAGGSTLWGVEGVVQVIVLDALREVTQGLSEKFVDTEDDLFDAQQKLAGELICVFGQGLMVFLLGNILEIADLVETSSELDEEEADVEMDSRSRRESIGSVGLIARRIMLPSGPAWQRMGICLWPHPTSAVGTESPAFEHVEVALA